MWARKAIIEAEAAERRGCRNWMGTLTCGPNYVMLSTHRARAAAALKGFDFDAESPESRFRLIDREVYRDIAKFLKRVRKGGALFRFLIVTEAHKSGVPHYHILIHETDTSRPVKKALLRGQWIGGFEAFRLVRGEPSIEDSTGDEPFVGLGARSSLKAVVYVCKYLSKTGGRVRASLGYGTPAEPGSDNRLVPDGNSDDYEEEEVLQSASYAPTMLTPSVD